MEEAASVADIGLTHKDIHEARTIRDAEAADPGIVRRALDEKLAAGEEPTTAALRQKPRVRTDRSCRGSRRSSVWRNSTRRMMHVADKYADKPNMMFALNATALYELAAPSTPPEVQAEVERRVAAGEIIGAADVKKLKQQAQEIVQDHLRWPHPPRRASACRHGGAEADARFLWPQRRWHCRHWPGRALALSALVPTELVAREAGSINPQPK